MSVEITQDRIRELKEWLEQHPIDPAWDEEIEYHDEKRSCEQAKARLVSILLRIMGELP